MTLPSRLKAYLSEHRVEFTTLAHRIDQHLLREAYQRKRKSGAPRCDGVTAAEYAEAYRRCDNVAARREQIELIGRIGRDLDNVVHRSLVYNTVLLSRKPAELAGLSALHHFIERGFRAFRHMEGADEFLETIMAREFTVMDGILSDAPTASWRKSSSPACGWRVS